MQNQSSRPAKIAANTIVLFLRMFVLMVVNLYAVRLLLNGLGQTDYGLFNTVAGVVTSTFFLSSILAFSVQRFYSIALGEGDNERFSSIYSSSLNIAVFSSMVIILLLETVGVWFIMSFLSIPAARFDVTLSVYHYSVFTLVFTFIQVPFLAAIYAHEDMNIFSIISTIEAILRLAAAWIAGRVMMDGLLLYGILLFVISVLITSVYAIVAVRKYSCCHYVLSRDRSIYSQLLSFSGWYTFGTMANTGMNQGNTILLNIYFGPIANAAFAVASQIQNAFNSLCNSMVLPFRPAMIKAYAEGNHRYVCRLFYANNKVICFFMILTGFPIISEMDVILNLWLGTYDSSTLIFARLTVVSVMLIAFHNPISIIMHAIGKVMQYHLPVETTILLCCPITWILFHYGLPSYVLYYVIIGLVVAAHALRLLCIRKHYAHFSLHEYIVSFLWPSMYVVIPGIVLICLTHYLFDAIYLRLLGSFILFPVVITILFYALCLDKEEKIQSRKLILSIISKFK